MPGTSSEAGNTSDITQGEKTVAGTTRPWTPGGPQAKRWAADREMLVTMPTTRPTDSDVQRIYDRCAAEFAARVHAVDGRWDRTTELPGWDVRDLVHHLVHEERWTPPLLAGATMEEVGDRFEGDLLGDDPVAAFDEAAAEALAAVRADGVLGRTVHLSFGDHPGSEYVMQLSADHLVHAVDLARALGVDETVDPEVAEAVLGWFTPMEDMYREFGVIGPRVGWEPDAAAQARLLGMMGRRPTA